VDDSEPLQLFHSETGCCVLGLHPRGMRASWWSPPVLQGGGC